MNANEQPKHEVSSAPLLHGIRGVRVILDTDLARLYGVETRALKNSLICRHFRLLWAGGS
jgi:hypothetical protein